VQCRFARLYLQEIRLASRDYCSHQDSRRTYSLVVWADYKLVSAVVGDSGMSLHRFWHTNSFFGLPRSNCSRLYSVAVLGVGRSVSSSVVGAEFLYVALLGEICANLRTR